ncbi:MAG: glycine oxidase ThiO [Ardenticatenales bacterium]|nr:glycine oxidase ThiO [Ardenticatenales bacterium]
MIVIVGGGIIGLAIGWELAKRGVPSTIVERGEAGRGASWAAAGMLPPHAEVEPAEERLLPLLLAGRALWPAYAAELTAATGIDVDYRTDGALLVALDRDDAAQLKFRHDLQRRHGLTVEWLSGGEARQLEPYLSRAVTAAVFSPDDHCVDNRAVVVALAAAYRGAGGVVREHTEVVGLRIERGRAVGVDVAVGVAGRDAGDGRDVETLAADAVVVAAGAWSRGLPGLPEIARPPVRPVKGQMLALRMDAAAPIVTRMIWAPDAYLVPRGDGRLLVGATVEEHGFDTTLTAGGIRGLLEGAWEAVPGCDELPLIETWAGLRPTSRDDAPILGPTAVEGLWLATGHHRNGVLLAPITGALIAEGLVTGGMPEAGRGFGVERFG